MPTGGRTRKTRRGMCTRRTRPPGEDASTSATKGGIRTDDGVYLYLRTIIFFVETNVSDASEINWFRLFV